ncbi:MAG: winged helix-turn-helix domain-containing protein [Algicola sp.]|nr:winged helix-turn-helix domain-containing protein [Algicola sp.]
MNTRLIINEWTLDSDTLTITRADETRKLQKKQLELLEYFIQHANITLPISQIAQNVWPDTVVSDDSIYTTIAKLRKLFALEQNTQPLIKTITKKGYIFVGDLIEEQSAQESEKPSAQPNKETAQPQQAVSWRVKNVRFVSVGLLLTLFVTTALFYLFHQLTLTPTPEPGASAPLLQHKTAFVTFERTNSELSINKYIVSGLYSNISDTLSTIRHRYFINIKPEQINQTFLQTNAITDVLTGLIEQSNTEVSIKLKLTDATSNNLKWTKTFSASLDNLQQLQQQIYHHMIAQNNPSQSQTDTIGQLSESDFTAYARALDLIATRHNENFQPAITILERLKTVNPRSTAVFATAAKAYALWAQRQTTPQLKRQLAQKSLLDAKHVIAIDNNNTQALTALGIVYCYLLWDWDKALHYFTQAEASAPNNAEINNFLGDYYRIMLNHAKAYFYERKAFELSPQSPFAEVELAQTELWIGESKTAIERLQRLQRSPNQAVSNSALFQLLAWRVEKQPDGLMAALEPLAQSAVGFRAMFIAYLQMVYSINHNQPVNDQLIGFEEKFKTLNFFNAYLGDLYLKIGEYDKATGYLYQAMRNRELLLLVQLKRPIDVQRSAKLSEFFAAKPIKRLLELRDE